MASPLEIGTRVRVILPPTLDGDEPEFSAETTIAAIQFVNEAGEIVDQPQPRWQYVLDGDEPFANSAFVPELLERVE